MKLRPRFAVLALATSLLLPSCNTANSLLSAPVGMIGRMFQAVGRTSKLLGDAETKDQAAQDDRAAVAARGQKIQQRPEHTGLPATAPQSDEQRTAMLKR